MGMRKAAWALALLLMLVICCTQAVEAAALSWGSTGEKVSEVQRRLKQWGYYDGAVDGTYGQSTYNAVVAFQKKNGLKADGIVGAATAAAIGITLSDTGTSASAGYGGNDLDLLARIVHGEARGEPYTGKVAVAAVVLNRVKHPSFPNTIAGVIYQPGAFDAVNDGQFYLTPDEDAYRAARDALNGWDPTYGCIYYYNPARATSAWIFSREVRLTIGKHAFAI